MIRAFGYARVSLESEVIDNQVVAIQEFARGNNIDLVAVFRDVGVSGSMRAFERDGFRKMLEFAEITGIKTIIVYDLTRLGRDLFDVIETYRLLLERGYTVLFVKHPELNITGDSPLAQAIKKAILAVLAIVAEMERALIIERTREALERARREGKRLGRRPVEIPVDVVKKYLRMGLSKKDIYRLLIAQGYLKYREKGQEKILSYDRFLKRLKQLRL